MPLIVTTHAIGRYRERFPAHGRWWDAEIVGRVRWLAARSVEVGNGPGKRFLLSPAGGADGGAVLVLCGGRVATVLAPGWLPAGNWSRAVPRRRKGLKPVRPGRLRPAAAGKA